MASALLRSPFSPSFSWRNRTRCCPGSPIFARPLYRSAQPQAAIQTNDRPPAPTDATRGPPPALQQVVQEMQTMGLSDTDLKSTPIHYFWVTSACVSLAALLGRGFAGASGGDDIAACLITAVLGYIVADMATGLYHFGVDNYGSAKTPVFGGQIDAFQGHHRRPWTITKRQFANNLQALARPVFFTMIIFLALPGSPARDSFFSIFFACVMFSQQFHAWAHTPRPLLPTSVIALQDAGLLVSRKMHGAHHRPPFNCNYCIVSGICNRPMDSLGVFTGLEKGIFRMFGVAPRSWSEAAPSWLEGDECVSYYEDGSNLVE